MVSKAENIHKTSAVTTAALGRLMTAASMMGVMLKGKDDSVTLRLNGGVRQVLFLPFRTVRAMRGAMLKILLLKFRLMIKVSLT